MQDLELRSYIPEKDAEQQRELFLLSFPENKGTSICSEEHSSWKFEQFPGTPPSYQYVARNQEDILGYYAAIPYPYKINQSEIRCGMVCDVMTHPKSRGHGIFTKIGHFATQDLMQQGLGFTSGYPIRPEVIPGHLKVGWKKVLKLPMYMKILKTKTLLPKGFRFLAFFLDPLFYILNCVPRIFGKFHSQYKTEVEGIHLFDEKTDEIDEFLSSWISEQKNALLKSSAFLKWRTSAPKTIYQFIFVREIKSQKIVALSIVRPTNIKGVEVLAVLDFMTLKAHRSSSNQMIEQMTELALKLKKDAIVCMTTRKWARQYRFLNHLMLPTPAIFTLILKKLDSKIDEMDLFTEDNWHLFWIDSDDL